MEPTKKMLENTHKVVYLANEYPKHKLTALIALLGMPAIEINTAFWYAEQLGFLGEPDPKTEQFARLKQPEQYQLGEAVEELKAMIVFSFKQLAKKEQDLEENYLSNWTLGYTPHDVLIAMRQLLGDKVLAEYELTDPKDTKSTYRFFTLYENGEQMWGRKQFKVEPTGEEQPDNSEPTAPAESEK